MPYVPSYITHLGGVRLFSCANCDIFLTNRNELVSTRFTGATGRAFLFNRVVNLDHGEVQDRVMLTGRHMVRDVSCKKCKIKLVCCTGVELRHVWQIASSIAATVLELLEQDGNMKSFRAVETDDGKAYFIFSDVEAENSCINSISIILSDGLRHFYSKLNQIGIQGMAERSKLAYPQYCEQLLSAMTDGGGVAEYFYDVACDDSVCSLTWKRTLTQTASYHLGTVHLASLTGTQQAEAAVDMLKFCSGEIASLRNKLRRTEEACRQMASDRDGALNDYQEAVEAKIRNEEELFAKFANILNEKKKRIDELEKMVRGNVESMDSNGSPKSTGQQNFSSGSERTSPTSAVVDRDVALRARRFKRGGQRRRALKKPVLP
uniref:Yippee domain-containing protein n=1 Tax=Trichuris muris TaxID=70415 RepID=A0A5S6R3V5_TRIMR